MATSSPARALQTRARQPRRHSLENGVNGHASENGLAFEIANLLGTAGRRALYPAGVVVVHKGDPGNSLYLILRGRLKVTLPSAHGEGLLVNVLEAGQAFGELAFLDRRPQPFTVIAAKPTELLMVRREELESLPQISCDLEGELLATLYEQMRDAYETMEDVVYLDVAGRLAKKLLRLAERYGRQTTAGIMINLRLTQGDLAAMLGVTRETVNKHLKVFRTRGLIGLHAQQLIVRRPEELRRRIY